MPLDYAAVRADLLAQREAIDQALRAFDVIFPTRTTTDGAYVLAPAAPPPAPVLTRSPRQTSADTADTPTRPRKAPTRRAPAAKADDAGQSNIAKSQKWQGRALEALRAEEEPATVRELATRLRETGEEAYQALWRALQLLVAQKAVVRTGTRYALRAKVTGEAA